MTALERVSLKLPLWEEMTAWTRTGILLALGWAALLLLYAGDTAMLADVYVNSSVYEHCILILPIVGWLVWQRRDALAEIEPDGWAPGLVWLAGGLVCWLAGYGLGINVGRHLGLVVMAQGIALSLIGPNVARALIFPIAYSFFLVPVGDQLVGPMQIVTADIAMALLGLTGIAATLDGIFINTDFGLFRVAEACAGVNFLIAMFALGVLIAHLGFKSWPKRIVFVAAGLAFSVFGNGLRAWGTMWIARTFGLEYADGLDHLIYGWIFFALLTAILVSLGWRFFDRMPEEHGIDPADYRRPVRYRLAQTLMLPLALLLALPGYALATEGAAPVAMPKRTLLPPVAGWQPVASPEDYMPHFQGADHRVIQGYRDEAGHRVDLFLALYGRQDDGGELISVNQRGVDTENGWVWTSDLAPIAAADADGAVVRLTDPKQRHRAAAVFYRLAGETTGDPRRVQWLTLKQRLTGGDSRAAAIVVSAEGDDARADIAAFLKALGPVGAMADRVTGVAETD